MTSIEHLTLQSFRNITEIKMPFSPGIHFIFGENGSGKTSLLESLYSLTHGRSFRSRQTQQMVQDNKDLFRVIISIRNDSAPYLIGWEKHKKKDSILKVNGDIIQQFSTIAAKFPTLFIDTDSHRQLASGPKSRRQFIDWAVFHCIPEYHAVWRNYQTCLAQRNSALKSNLDVSPWTKGLCAYANKIDEFRQAVTTEWSDHFNFFLPKFDLTPLLLSVKYDRGWDVEKSLDDCLQENYEKDLRLGFTHSGPHRADLKVYTNKDLVFQRLSQGQQKVITYAMRLSQARLLKKSYSKNSLILIDDLPAELDQPKRRSVISALEELSAQSLITGILKRDVLALAKEHACFSISQGELSSFTNTES